MIFHNLYALLDMEAKAIVLQSEVDNGPGAEVPWVKDEKSKWELEEYAQDELISSARHLQVVPITLNIGITL